MSDDRDARFDRSANLNGFCNARFLFCIDLQLQVFSFTSYYSARYMNKYLVSILVAALAANLAGCGKSGADQNSGAAADTKTSSQAPQDQKAGADVKKEPAPAAGLPQADKATAEDKYSRIDSGAQLAYLYYAVSGMPIDYEKVAQSVSNDYRMTSNEFKKKELLDSLKPKIDQQVAFYKANRYVVIDSDFTLEHIDMATKSFPMRGIPNAQSYIYFNDSPSYKVGLTNADAFKNFKTTSDDQAREIEGMVEKYRANGKVNMYLFAQDIDLNSGTIKFQAVKLRLIDSTGKTLGEMI